MAPAIQFGTGMGAENTVPDCECRHYSPAEVGKLWLVREWESMESEPKAPQEPMTIQTAAEAFVTDAEDQRLAGATISKYHLLFKQLGNFVQNRGLRYLTELSLERLGEFRSSWKDGGSALSFVLHKIGTGSQRIQQAR
jgi:hypothetical protein